MQIRREQQDNKPVVFYHVSEAMLAADILETFLRAFFVTGILI